MGRQLTVRRDGSTGKAIEREQRGKMSVEDAINYKASEEEDYYALLSCDESATVSPGFVDLSGFCGNRVSRVVRVLLQGVERVRWILRTRFLGWVNFGFLLGSLC